jgi:hypothetical protein
MEIDNWQKGYAELRRELAKLKQENLATKDELTKLRRTYEDQIDNLTLDNMPSVREIALKTEGGVAGLAMTVDETVKKVEVIAANQTTQGDSIALIRVTSEQAANDANNAKNAASSAVASVEILTETVTDQGKSITSVSQATGKNTASIESLASVQTEQGESIASVTQKATELESEVSLVAKTQTEQGTSIASLTQKTNEQDAEISFAVEHVGYAEEAANEAKENVSNGAYIVARVNEDGSTVKIKADKLELSGYATFSSLSEPGKTEIDGANLKTGTVVADRIAMNENGQIDFSNLGSLDFLTESGASGSIRLNENEYGRGEIGISADMYVGISGGSASVILNETPNYGTEMRVYADNFVMNDQRGVTGDFSLGNGSITVVNGIVVNVVEGGGGGGGDEPITLYAPDVSVNAESASFSIYNPNGRGTIYYQLYYYDNDGDQWESDVRSSDDMSVVESFDELPTYGGLLVATAWVEYRGYTSPKASANDEMA